MTRSDPAEWRSYLDGLAEQQCAENAKLAWEVEVLEAHLPPRGAERGA
jgi:hypothetical protein